MVNGQKFFFFRCYNCGEWFYTNRIIKSKKCWKCNHSFLFKNSTKFSQFCSLEDAVLIVKKLKSRN
ncbi:MAG: DUF1922 domain-containing protein [Candidatus Hodarchaeota archaeon]